MTEALPLQIPLLSELKPTIMPGGHCCVKVDICFTAAGVTDIPAEQEILSTMEEIRENPQKFRFVA